MTRLEKAEREQLNQLIDRMRSVLVSDFGDVLEGRFGMRPDGGLEPSINLRLTDGERSTRRELEEVLEHFVAEGSRGKAGRDRLLREAVFTQVNRLVAIRIAEQIGIIPESVGRGRLSRGFKDLSNDVAPLMTADATGGYWFYLSLCGDELAVDAPSLFDPRNPLLALTPSPEALDEVIGLMGGLPPKCWLADDTLGWAYQFFNSDAERKEMRDGAPANSRELAVRNQFFTPDYVVSYLVHNSLGRRLLEADPSSGLREDLDWMIDVPIEKGADLDLADVRVIDPACGSGHFLLGAYDVLERAWHYQGVDPIAAAPRIVASLWGVDIDPRAAQVAAVAIVLRARRVCGTEIPLPRTNIVCARVLPSFAEADLSGLSADHRHILDEIKQELAMAPVLGSLLKVEELLQEGRARGMARTVERGMQPLQLVPESVGSASAIRDEVLDVLQRTADSVVASPLERLTAAEADDALRFVQAMSQRYDCVLMNPPFGEPVAGTKAYVKSVYPWIPTKDHNLFAAFVGRGLELCNASGYLGAITSRSGMFLTTFKEWRAQVVLPHRLVTLADLGFGVMEQALVEAAAYVLSPKLADVSHRTPILRMLREPAESRSEALLGAIISQNELKSDDRVFLRTATELSVIPGAPLAYWIDEPVRQLFETHQPLEGYGAYVRQGLATGDDFRFVRLYWEVAYERIGRSASETKAGRPWVPFAKGGEYSPYWSDIHLLVSFANEGQELRRFEGSRPQNFDRFFAAGLTWPLRTASGFSPRILPAGCAFGHKGPAVLPLAGQRAAGLLAWLTSRPAGALLALQLGAGDETSAGTASKSYEVGLVGKIPWPNLSAAEFGPTAVEIAEIVRVTDTFDETSHSFVAPLMDLTEPLAAAIGEHYRNYEDRVLSTIRVALSLEQRILEEIGKGVGDFTDTELGVHPGRLPVDNDTSIDIKALYQMSTEQLVANGISLRGGLRSVTQKTYVADRLIEVIAHGYQMHPSSVVDRRRSAGVLPSGYERDLAHAVLSYLVGCVFGRWDPEVGLRQAEARCLPDPFDLLPVSPPAANIESAGNGRLSASLTGLLLDEAGHSEDFVKRIADAGELFSGGLIENLEGILGRDLRALMRKQFFKDHLARYSKSRRKAPIYWPLYVPSREWGVWVYAPKLNRETLFAVAAAGDQRLGSAIAGTRRLETQLLEQGGRTTRDLAQELERERKLTEELRRFTDEARRIAEIGWAPDLDDGIVLCAAPLAELFPDWKTELVAVRKEIKKGLYDDWAHVSKYKAAL